MRWGKRRIFILLMDANKFEIFSSEIHSMIVYSYFYYIGIFSTVMCKNKVNYKVYSYTEMGIFAFLDLKISD